MLHFRRGRVLVVVALCVALTVASFALAEPTVLKGTVLLPDGQPAFGARVVTGSDNPATDYDLCETTTDAAGKFTLSVAGHLRNNVVAALLPGHPLALVPAKPGEEITIRFGDKSAAFTGTVLDQEGRPVAEVQVAIGVAYPTQARRCDLALFRHFTEYLLQTTTGAEGRFSIPDLPPKLTVWYGALAPGLAQTTGEAQVGHGDEKITLTPEATVAGRLRCGGPQVPGVLITCWGRMAGQLAVVTGADGTYRLEHLPAGEARLNIRRAPEGYAAPLLPVLTLRAGAHLTGQDFTFTPGALVTGKVTTAGTGAPVVGATVSCYLSGAGKTTNEYRAQTDATGVYHLRMAPGHGTLMVQGALSEQAYWTTGSQGQRNVDVAEGDTRAGLDFALTPPPTVHGKVLLPGGQPAAGARVFMAGGWPAANDHRTDAAGEFTLQVRLGSPEPYTCVAALEGYALGWAVAKQDQAVTVRLGDKPAAFSGLVTDAQGQPLAGALIALGLMMTGESSQGLYLGAGFAPLTTEADGRFSFGGLPAGVRVSYSLGARGYAANDGTTPVGAPELKIVLVPEATIAGTVRAGGKPVAGAQIRCASQDQNAWGATADDGTYHLGNLRAGTFTLTMQFDRRDVPEDYVAPAPLQITVKTGEHLVDQNVAFPRGAVLSGKVTDAATGKGLAGETVTVKGAFSSGETGPEESSLAPEEGSPAPEAQTDAHGVFHLRVAPGRWQLTVPWGAQNPNGWVPTPSSRSAEVAEGEVKGGLDFTVAPEPALHGRVLRPDGRPAAGALLGLGLPGMWKGGWEVLLPDKATADGSFTVRGIDRRVYPPITLTPQTPVTLLAMIPEAGLVASAQVTDPGPPLTLHLAAGAYGTVHVTDPQGRPLARVSFQSWWYPPGRAVGADVFAGSCNLPEAVSDEQGNVRIGPVPTGTLLARVEGPEDSYVTSVTWVKEDLVQLSLPVKQGETAIFPNMEIDRTGRSASGWVADADGHPVANALVIGEQGTNPTCRTDARGFFALTGLALRGPLWLVAADPTRPLYGGQQLKLEPGAQAHFVLRPLGTLIGQIVNAQHLPVASAQVIENPEDGWWMETTTLVRQLQVLLGRRPAPAPDAESGTACDQEGRFRVEDLLAPLRYRLWVFGPGFSGGPPDELDHWYTVRPGETTYAGQVLVHLPRPETATPPATLPALHPAPFPARQARRHERRARRNYGHASNCRQL